MHQSTLQNLQGIVLRAHPSGESDLVLKVLTQEQGKVSLFARASRNSAKRNPLRFDLFDHGRFEVKSGRGALRNVQGFVTIDAYRKIRADLNKIIIASMICECFDLLVSEEIDNAREAEEVYNMLRLGLSAVEESVDLKEACRAAFFAIANVLRSTGFLNDTAVPIPSAKHLIGLLNQVEHSVEKQLRTRESILQVLGQIQLEQSSTGQT